MYVSDMVWKRPLVEWEEPKEKLLADKIELKRNNPQAFAAQQYGKPILSGFFVMLFVGVLYLALETELTGLLVQKLLEALPVLIAIQIGFTLFLLLGTFWESQPKTKISFSQNGLVYVACDYRIEWKFTDIEWFGFFDTVVSSHQYRALSMAHKNGKILTVGLPKQLSRTCIRRILSECGLTESLLLQSDKTYETCVHPGQILRDELEARHLSPDSFASHIGVSSHRVLTLCRGQNPVDIEMAMKLSKSVGGTPSYWLCLQTEWDLAQSDTRSFEAIQPLLLE